MWVCNLFLSMLCCRLVHLHCLESALSRQNASRHSPLRRSHHQPTQTHSSLSVSSGLILGQLPCWLPMAPNLDTVSEPVPPLSLSGACQEDVGTSVSSHHADLSQALPSSGQNWAGADHPRLFSAKFASVFQFCPSLNQFHPSLSPDCVKKA